MRSLSGAEGPEHDFCFYDLYDLWQGNDPIRCSDTDAFLAAFKARLKDAVLGLPVISNKNAYSRGQPRMGREIIFDRFTFSARKVSRKSHSEPGVFGR